MATPRFVGNAESVAQVDTLAVAGTIEADDVFTVTINGKPVEVTAGSTTAATVATAIFTALDALDDDLYPEFAEITWDDVGDTVTATASEPGRPHTITVSTTEAGGGAADDQTFTKTATTPSSGPLHWDTAANWSTGATPASGDTVYLDNTERSILYGLAQSGVTLAALIIAQSFEGTIGLPKENEDGGYPEYRADYLAIGASAVSIGQGVGNGSGRIKLDTGSVQTAVTVHNTGSPEEADLEAFLWKGTHASNTLTVRGDSSVGVAVFGGETATIATLRVEGNARVRCGAGVTLTTVVVHGGELELNSAVTTLTVLGGRVVLSGTGAVTTINARGGEIVYNTTGTLGTLTVSGDAVVDFSQEPTPKTLTNPVELHGSACRVLDPSKVVNAAGSLIVDFNESGPEGQVVWGNNVRLTRAATA